MSDVWSEWEAVRNAPPPAAPATLAAVPARLPEPASIPPREWLYGTRLIRRFVSLLVAPGGVGKTALALGQAAAVAAGRGFLGERVHRSVPAWVLNLEDPLDELHRRLAALMAHHHLDRSALEGRLFLHSGRTRRIAMAEFGADRTDLVHPDRAAIVESCLSDGIGLLVVDPFVKSHRLDENSNAQIDAAATAWAEIAEATGAAVLLVHHVRKGAGETGDVEAARGAKSLSDAARAASILSPMSAAEATRFAIPAGERWRHVRLDDAKANLAPRGSAALWYRLETVALGNASPDYPNGDHVAVIAPWRPPTALPAPAAALAGPAASAAPALGRPAVDARGAGKPPPAEKAARQAQPVPLAGIAPARCNAVLDRLAAGPEPGLAYTIHRGGTRTERWAGHVLTEELGLSPAVATRLLIAWLEAGLLRECAYRDPHQRRRRLGLRVIDARRPRDPDTSSEQ